MKTKHTPGPWQIEGVGNIRTIFMATGTSAYPVAVVEVDKLKRFGSGDLDATASLIAAAPEMLGALLRLRNMLILNQDFLHKYQDTADLMNAAIAKATGGDE